MRRTLFLLKLKSLTDSQTSLRFAMYDSNMSAPRSVSSFFDCFGGGSHAMKTNLKLFKCKSCYEIRRRIKSIDRRSKEEKKCWKVCFDKITCKYVSVPLRTCPNSRAFGHDASRDYWSSERAQKHWKRDTTYPSEATTQKTKRFRADLVEICFGSSQVPITVEFIARDSSYRGFDSRSHRVNIIIFIIHSKYFPNSDSLKAHA